LPFGVEGDNSETVARLYSKTTKIEVKKVKILYFR